MAPCEIRYGLLVRPAWELRAIPVGTWLVLPCRAEPVLYVAAGNGRKDTIVVVRRDGHWRLLWRGAELDGGHLGVAARHIAAGTAV
ncbi:hypothetical protein ACRYCC_40025 [Actinomadura scrupuli]|uniref:hypothetical protein n=1 Tax=Actinomadura scrupuli TaxID=559629 RepID=UPI003D99A538